MTVAAQHVYGQTDLYCARCGTRWRDRDNAPCPGDWHPGARARQRKLPPPDELKRLRAEGKTMQAIGEAYGVSRQAVEHSLKPKVIRGGRLSADSEYVDPSKPHLSWIRLVCEPPLRRALVLAAERDHTTLSEIVRRACRQYLEGDER